LFSTKNGTETALSSQNRHTLQYKMVGVHNNIKKTSFKSTIHIILHKNYKYEF